MTVEQNVGRKEGFTQVCVWPACIVGAEKIEEFEAFMLSEMKVRVQYLEEIKTGPDRDRRGCPIVGTGDRNDLFFVVHGEDVWRFAIPRLQMGIRWIEDVLANVNYTQPIYPERVRGYKTWDAGGQDDEEVMEMDHG